MRIDAVKSLKCFGKSRKTRIFCNKSLHDSLRIAGIVLLKATFRQGYGQERCKACWGVFDFF